MEGLGGGDETIRSCSHATQLGPADSAMPAAIRGSFSLISALPGICVVETGHLVIGF